MAKRVPAADGAVLSRLFGQRNRTSIVIARKRGERERDRKRPGRTAEERLVQVGIERGQLLGGRLFRKLRVRPEPLARPGGRDAVAFGKRGARLGLWLRHQARSEMVSCPIRPRQACRTSASF